MPEIEPTRQTQGYTRQLLSRAVKTLVVVRDPDAALYTARSMWPEMKPENWIEWHEMAKAKADRQKVRFKATPFDVDNYLDVLAWLRGVDARIAGPFIAYESDPDVTWRRLSRSVGISERHLRRLIENMIFRIAAEHTETINGMAQRANLGASDCRADGTKILMFPANSTANTR